MRQQITRLLEPLFWKVKGLDFQGELADFRENQFIGMEEYRSRRLLKLKQISEYAVAETGYYRNHGPSLTDIESACSAYELLSLFPIVDKNELKSKGDEFKGVGGKGSYIQTTGGSTGTPLAVWQDTAYFRAAAATTQLMYEWTGWQLGEPLIKLWGAQRDLINGSLGWKHKTADFIANRITLDCFRMSIAHMKSYVQALNQRKPRLLEGYADSLYELASFIEKKDMLVYSPGSIVSAAGTLMPHMREKIEAVFKSPVFDRYGSREAGNMAAECSEHKGLHVFGETTILEVVDPNGNPVPAGEEGEIVVTNLFNFTMPLIRYKIGDRGTFAKHSCACGRPYELLANISGRQSGAIRLRGGGCVSPGFFIHCVGVMHYDPEVSKFQIIQENYNDLTIRVVRNGGLTNWTQRDAIEQDIRKAVGPSCRIKFELVDDIPPTATGKHLYTVCEID